MKKEEHMSTYFYFMLYIKLYVLCVWYYNFIYIIFFYSLYNKFTVHKALLEKLDVLKTEDVIRYGIDYN